MSKHTTKLDAKGRVSIGRYTELEAGAIFRIERLPSGALTLTPVLELAEEEER